MKNPWLMTPADAMKASAEWTRLMTQSCLLAQNAALVIGRRNMLMLSGKMTAAEATRMVLEKPAAFAEAAEQATAAALKGKAPAAIASAALKPVARKAKANAKRL